MQTHKYVVRVPGPGFIDQELELHRSLIGVTDDTASIVTNDNDGILDDDAAAADVTTTTPSPSDEKSSVFPVVTTTPRRTRPTAAGGGSTITAKQKQVSVSIEATAEHHRGNNSNGNKCHATVEAKRSLPPKMHVFLPPLRATTTRGQFVRGSVRNCVVNFLFS